MLDIIGNLFGQPLNIMIQDHEIIICPPLSSSETYRIILERPPNEKVNQIQDKIVLKVKILDTGLVLIPYQGYASECHSVLLDNLYLRFLMIEGAAEFL